MKHLILVLSCASLLFAGTGCNKECKPKAPAKEVPQITAFASANGITPTAHPSGLYYEIITEGSGQTANANSAISIIYRGTFLDGRVFDERTTASPAWALSDLIEGWKIGIPLIKEGGRIKLIVPSSLAYGCEPYLSIPGNSVLYFDISLLDVQ